MMWNEHSVCEREIEELKEEVEYYQKLHQNEYEARQRLMKETKQYKKALVEIRDYEAYSWNNDREFINSRLKVLENVVESARIYIKHDVSGTHLLD